MPVDPSPFNQARVKRNPDGWARYLNDQIKAADSHNAKLLERPIEIMNDRMEGELKHSPHLKRQIFGILNNSQMPYSTGFLSYQKQNERVFGAVDHKCAACPHEENSNGR